MNKKLIILLAVAALVFVFGFFLKEGSWSTSLVWNLSNGGKWLLPLVGIAALVDSINPCAFSILILTIAFLLSIGKVRSSILKLGGLYVLGIFVVYMLIGLGILQTLHIFDTPHFMAKVGAALLIGLGSINLINEFFPAFPMKLRIPQVAHHKMAELMEKGSWVAVFLLGALVGLCEFPCTGGPYLMVLGLLHDQATYLKGVGYLILYNLIFVTPLVLILLIAGNQTLLEKVRSWQRRENKLMRFGGGIAMILLGIIIFFL
ncbi:MAG: hypothetical protein G01um10143_570 [Parcubacteria group bacterium Gr01-1014_3]|nr:MAG: hypothetical protein G01um10143_570 [Parcubacteria group bacterium Gr01-1014_3]